jgi:signal transduction histidine kinase
VDARIPQKRSLTAVAAVGTVVVLVAFASMWWRGRPLDVQYGLYMFHNGPTALLLFWLGRLVLLRRRGSNVGGVLFAIAVLGSVHIAVAAWADVAIVEYGYTDAITYDHPLIPADMPLSASIPLWIMNWLWVPQVVLAVTILPLIFPDGRLPGRRWRIAVWLSCTGAVLVVAATVIDGWPTSTWPVEEPPTVVTALFATGGPILLVAAVLGFVAMVVQWRRSTAERRDQFRVVGITVGVFALVSIATYPWQRVWIPAVLVMFYVLLAAYALAAARYRLHDLEPVFGKAAVATILSVLVAAVYLTIVVGIGSIIGRSSDNALLPLIAVGLVALLIEPARRRARRLVDRILFRRKADRTEVVSRLAERGTTSANAVDMLTDVVELLIRSTGAERAEAWLERDGHQDLMATAGSGTWGVAALVAPMANQEHVFGELRLFAHAAADLTPDARHILGDTAHVVGTAVHNARLTAQLQDQLHELRASRRRLIEAHDTARRGLERDIHDGAQSRLISLRLRIGALKARNNSVADHPMTSELDTLAGEIDAAVGSLRDLARGLHPPILDQSGLVDALRAHVRYLPVPVTVRSHDVGRYEGAVESAAYFSCLEAVQNALRHSGAGAITIDIVADEKTMRFTVSDDGTGFDTAAIRPGTGLANIGDRMSALGGDLRIDSAAGRGTRVTGTVPAHPTAEKR